VQAGYLGERRHPLLSVVFTFSGKDIAASRLTTRSQLKTKLHPTDVAATAAASQFASRAINCYNEICIIMVKCFCLLNILVSAQTFLFYDLQQQVGLRQAALHITLSYTVIYGTPTTMIMKCYMN